MAKLTSAEILERHAYYTNDVGLRELHDAARNYWHPLVTTAHVPDLPSFFTKGAMMSMNSPDLQTFMQGLLADFDSYNPIVNVSPHGQDGGNPTQVLKERADKLERFAAVLDRDFDNDGALTRNRIWSMGFSAYAVNILRVTADGWEVDSPAFDSCYFPVGNGACQRPAIMIRDYEVLATRAQELYSDDVQKRKPAKKDGAEWDWVPLSYEVSTQRNAQVMAGGGANKFAELVRIIWLDDGENIYHLLMNRSAADDPKGEAGGLIVYDAPNLTGGCSGLVIAGDATPLTESIDRIGPAHRPLLTDILNLNLLNSMEATMMVQARPDLAVEYSPEQIAAAAAAQILVPVGGQAVMQDIAAESTGGQTLIHLPGRATPLTFAPNESRQILREQWRTDRDRYMGEWREPAQPAVISQATVSVYLAARDAIRRRQSTQLVISDWARTTLVKMALHTIVERETSRAKNEPGFESDSARQKSYTRYARGGEQGAFGELSPGQGATITAADLIDFDYDLKVTTTGQTEADRRSIMTNGMQEVAWGLTSLAQVQDKAYVDGSAQRKALAEDAGLRLLRPIAMQALYGIFADKMRLKGGIVLPPLTPPTGAPLPAGPIGGQSQQMASPAGNPASSGGAAP